MIVSLALIGTALALIVALRQFRTVLPGGDLADFVVYPICIIALIAFGLGVAITSLAG